jgi:hypothetical protein
MTIEHERDQLKKHLANMQKQLDALDALEKTL